MKKTFFIIFMLVYTLVYPGGVDVGNGTLVVYYYTDDVSSEDLLKSDLGILKDNIEKFSDQKIIETYELGGCESGVKFGGVEKVSKFNIENDKVDYRLTYKGKVKLQFSDCKFLSHMPSEIGESF